MSKDIFSLSNKVVILTGGLGLIGLHYIQELIGRGAVVHILDLISSQQAQKILKSKIQKSTLSKLYYHEGDISNRQSLIHIRKEVLAQSGKIDVLINNAAFNPKVEGSTKPQLGANTFENLNREDWDREISVNLTGAMLCCQVFGSKMKQGSSIILISSVYGIVAPDQRIYPKGFIKPVTYSVSKGGVIALTQYLAAYWGKKGIRINSIAFGGVENSQNKDFIKNYAARTPMGRMAKPHEYNGIIVYLASDASSYSTGATYTVDGGWTTW